MLKNPLVSCVFRLLTLAVMLGAMALIVSTQRAQAAFEDCDTQFGYCIYQNCGGLTGSAYAACRDNCDVMFEQCLADEDYEPIPSPFPVITHNLQICLQGCQTGCAEFPDPDRIYCVGACQDWCFENNPKP